jgi:dTDP-4-amino-4,6-dideoxygalactose transaminase
MSKVDATQPEVIMLLDEKRNQESPIYCSFPQEGYMARRGLIDHAIQTTCSQGNYILGNECMLFEQEFSRYIGVEGGVGVANGTDSLTLIIKALGLGPSDEILTVSHTAVATVAAIRNAQVQVNLGDIQEGNYLLDPDMAHRWVTPRTKAVILVHLYGMSAPMDRWNEFCKSRGLYLIEDCAQSHGAYWRGERLGSFGIASSFSFYPTKNLGALGDGGMVISNDQSLIERVRMLRQYGWRERYHSEIEGCNSRLDELQAAILRVKLRYLDEDNLKRIHLARLYRKLLQGVRDIQLPEEEQQVGEHVYHLFVVRLSSQEKRNWLQEELKKRFQIHCLIHYPYPIHQQKAYQHLFPHHSLPVTELASQRILSLPLYPELGTDRVEYVCQAIRSILCTG